MPITDAQRALLRAALTRDDGLLPRSDRLAGAALSKVEAALTSAGLAEPVPVNADQPRWREAAGVQTGLRITDVGRAAAGGDQQVAQVQAPDDAPPTDNAVRDPGDAARTASAERRSSRPGSKAARLVAMLSEAEGTTVDAVSTALAWQPHTVRAALTRLRQSGLAVVASKEAGRPATYRIRLTVDITAPVDTEAAG